MALDPSFFSVGDDMTALSKVMDEFMNDTAATGLSKTKQDSTGKDARVKNAHPQLKKLHRQRVESGLASFLLCRQRLTNRRHTTTIVKVSRPQF
ncbi:Protein HOL1 [Fusarium oxysporum f. sp. albedinis]|nr:Protein HOL1 [Fusarium oxysporum f. sp. albedinis]